MCAILILAVVAWLVYPPLVIVAAGLVAVVVVYKAVFLEFDS